jgi:hypothetical protein
VAEVITTKEGLLMPMALLSLDLGQVITTVDHTGVWLDARLLFTSDVKQECLYSTILEVELQQAAKTTDKTRWPIKHQAAEAEGTSPQEPTASRKLMTPK